MLNVAILFIVLRVCRVSHFLVVLFFVYAGVKCFICYAKCQCLCIVMLSIIHDEGGYNSVDCAEYHILKLIC
jgi:hypothetical protein